MANRSYKRDMGTLEQGVVKLYAKVTVSTSGTITATSCKGLSIAKTGSETGRYTVTLEDVYASLLACQVMIEGAADAAYTSAKGLVAFLRNVAVATTKTFDIQFCDPDGSPADAELETSAKFYVEITLKNSGV